MSYEGRKPSSFPRNCAQLNIWTLRDVVAQAKGLLRAMPNTSDVLQIYNSFAL